jgi:hypothetical protein
MKVKVDGRKRSYTPKDSDKVECHTHGIVTTWGALNGIQQLACAEGIDTTPDLPCLLAPQEEDAQ